MMYGLKDEFEYLECQSCGCLQLLAFPENIAKYYPEDFYAYKQQPGKQYQPPTLLRRMLRRARAKYLLTGTGVLGKIIHHFTGDYFGNSYDWRWFRETGVSLDAAILDIGCGSGKLLRAMEESGFSRLSGIDPYIENNITHGPINIYKQSLDKLDGAFDLLMLHHSFEHMPDPALTLKQMNSVLKPGGHAIIRVPLAASYAWKKYGTYWVQLDAPRHAFLHTPKSIAILAKLSGFELTDVVFDSTAFQFMGSEQYLQDIPLRHAKSYVNGLAGSIFTKESIALFEQEAERLNKSGEGDQACFYLKKISDLN